jgi:hypothetical protein
MLLSKPLGLKGQRAWKRQDINEYSGTKMPLFKGFQHANPDKNRSKRTAGCAIFLGVEHGNVSAFLC